MMPCVELGDAVPVAELLKVSPSNTATGELIVTALLLAERLWNRWWPPPQYCGCAFPCIGTVRARPKKATNIFIVD